MTLSDPHRFGPLVLVLSIVVLGGCSPDRSTWDLAQRAVDAMGGGAVGRIETIVMSGGEGTRDRLGQRFEEGGRDATAALGAVTTTLDLAGGRAAFEYDVSLESGFMQHRVEVLTDVDGQSVGYSVNDNNRMASTPGGLFSWGPQNSPVTPLHRNAVTLLVEAGQAGDSAVTQVEFGGLPRLRGTITTSWGEQFALFFDPESEFLVGFETQDTEPMLGDVQATYLLGDYAPAGDVMMPHRITILKDGTAFSDVRYASVAINEPGADRVLQIPEDLAGQAHEAIAHEDWVPLAWTPVTEDVTQVVAYSHHSMVVEFPTFVAVVEAPYTETQSLALAELVAQRIPGKPIAWVAVTHPHFDHTGGIRAMAGLGATILVASGHERQMRRILDTPRTHPPDLLAEARQNGTAGRIEVYEDTVSVTEGSQRLDLFEVSGSPHVEPVVLAWVPSRRVLFQSDLFFPGSGGAGNDTTEHLEETIGDLGLGVETLVGGHGGVGPYSELLEANRSN